MDRLSQLRGEAGGARDSTLDTTSPPSEAFMTANESSSKYFSLSEVDSTFDISSIKDVSLATTTTDSDATLNSADELISNLSPIGKKSDVLDSYKIDTQIEAANILSGGVAIFDDNDNSCDGDELVIDDNVEVDEKTNSELKQPESLQFKTDENIIESSLLSEEADIASKDTEVVLQIDGKNVDAIDIGNGLYLYRKEGQEELAAVQIINDDQQQPSFKFLKVRENAEGNLEVYEEIEIEVPKEVPAKEGKTADKNTSSHVPIKDINKVISDSTCNKVAERKIKTPRKEPTSTTVEEEIEDTEIIPDTKSEVNLNGKMMKFSESRKSPVIGSFKPMTYHSTPNKEGIPLTKTMVDQQLHTNRHSDLSNVKKTIEVHTDSCKQKPIETPIKNNDAEDNKLSEISSTEKDAISELSADQESDVMIAARIDSASIQVKTGDITVESSKSETSTQNVDSAAVTDEISEQSKDVPMDQDSAIDSTEKEITKEEILESKETDNMVKDQENLDIQEEMKVEENTVEEPKIDVEKHTESSDPESKQDTTVQVTQFPTEPLGDSQAKIDIEVINNKISVEKPDETKLSVEETVTNVKGTTVPDVKESSVPLVKKSTVPHVKESTVPHIKESTVPNVKKSEVVFEENTQKLAEVNKVGNLDVKHDATSEPILIEDDDVCIIEEIVVENKENHEVKNQSDSKNEIKSDNDVLDSVKNTESASNVSKDFPNVQATTLENISSRDEQKGQADPTSSNTIIISESKRDSDPVKQSTNKATKMSFVEVTESIKESFPSLADKQKTIGDVITSSSTEKISEQSDVTANQEKTEKLSSQKIVQQESEVLDITKRPSDEKALKTIELLKVKETPNKRAQQKTEDKLAISDILTITDENQDTSIPLDVAMEILVPENVEEKSPVMDTQSIETSNITITSRVEQKNEYKIVEKSARADPVKTNFTVETPLVSTQIHVDSTSDLSLPVEKYKRMHVVDSVANKTKAEIPKTVKNIALERPKHASNIKAPFINQREEKKDMTKVTSLPTDKGKGVISIEISKVPKVDPTKISSVHRQDISSTSSKASIMSVKNKVEIKDRKEVPKTTEAKPINNNNAAVPFGKWTEANRQEFLNKFKTKASVASSNSNQLKNSNDLNRRDVLKKIDSQRQSNNALSKIQEANKPSVKVETAAFSNKPNIINKSSTQETKISQKTEAVEVKLKAVAPKNVTKVEAAAKPDNEATGSVSKKESGQRTGVVQNLIDKTIEGMIHRAVSTPRVQAQEEPKQNTVKEPAATKPTNTQTYQPLEQATLDEIEMKMNELHGIPFIERPPHELPQVYKPESIKSYSKVDKEKTTVPNKTTKIPNLLPFANKSQPKIVKEPVIEVESEDEIIEHEPITGDIDVNQKSQVVKPAKDKLASKTTSQGNEEKLSPEAAKKEAIITEKDFDKFARRNSITYENCLTVNFDGKEPHNVIQTVVEKDSSPKNYSKVEANRLEPKAKLSHKYQNVRPNTQAVKLQSVNKFASANDDASNRNQSKLQKAYHSALTAKRHMTTEYPITIIEDKPVKVVFMDSVDYVPQQLNVQGQDLSPAKKLLSESDPPATTGHSLESDVVDSIDDTKSQEDIKIKTPKHQRKQVLTPVEEPELELIEPKDLGLEVSPKKKRRTDDDKNLKYPMRKKLYLLGASAATEEKNTNPIDITKNPSKDTVNRNDIGVVHKNTESPLDSLVKAAELIETQTENINTVMAMNSESQPSTPVKRGRGRPRKYPLPDGTPDKSKVVSPSPQKKPRLIDAKTPKPASLSDESDSEGEIIKENWTMGKINENIVCPICNKLFRTENVVFKHVKHCTGPSPSRSDSDKRSPRRMRLSQDFDTKSRDSMSDDMDIDDDKPLSTVSRKEIPKKRKSKDSITKLDQKDEIIIIEDTPIKAKPEKNEERKHESRKPRSKIPHKNNDLVCEFCGKTFRQLSYLVSHKLQHKKSEKPDPKKSNKEPPAVHKSVYSCEVCKKEFRKLHHLVQHRIIHNPSAAPARSSRQSSSEQSESKVDKESNNSKQSDDPSAGFRCEPCDKSFRKLHHLVEHRETHDGINRQKTTTAPPCKEEKVVEKPAPLHQCDVCKKTFRKLQHLNEHKEQHVETSSEKSDDKSVKSSLSTRDIIHECSLCYMVFPNEHSLTKHTIFCQRKKRQSKQLKTAEETEGGEEVMESPPPEERVENLDIPKLESMENSKRVELRPEPIENLVIAKEKIAEHDKPETTREKSVEPINVEKVKSPQKIEVKSQDPQVPQVPPIKRDFIETETNKSQASPEVPEKIKKIEEKEPKSIHETPKKKTPVKDKPTSASKRLKSSTAPTPPVVPAEVKPTVESSDDDEVRYMLNPNFKVEEVTEEKVFMKVRAKKRSSLQIERPNSKDLVKRRTSLQHPPKIPRLKPKTVEANTSAMKKEAKTLKLEPVPSTDSDDSETTKYSFPSTIPEKSTKPEPDRTPKGIGRKNQRKSLADKRKSLSGIAKRKSLGKAVTARLKVTPLKQIKKRTLDVEHRCDCGQLFSSAALLSRHTTLAHTPPRIRRRRSPEPEPKPAARPAPRKSSAADKPKVTPASRKSSARSDSSTSITTKPTKSDARAAKKSLDKATKSPGEHKQKPEKSEAKSSVKPRRTGAHRGVPVPEKMRKLMQKNK